MAAATSLIQLILKKFGDDAAFDDVVQMELNSGDYEHFRI